MHNLIGWWWDNKVVSQGLSLSILRLQQAGAMCSWPSSSYHLPSLKLFRKCASDTIIWIFQRGAKAGFRKGKGNTDQIANILWIIENARELQKNIYFCFIDYAKVFVCVDHKKPWKNLYEMGIPKHLTCLLRNLYAVQEARVRTRHGKMDMVQSWERSASRLLIVTLLV